jgi:phosphatidylserine/phosphatidylglycerophosphate/cardiolipin synthase-like enzyme
MDGSLTSKSPISLLSGPWDAQFADLLGTAEEFLLLASPFITRRVTTWTGNRLSKNAYSAQMRIVCLTNFRVDSILSGSLELDGIIEMGRAFQNFSVIHIPSLHAKVFIADEKRAIITSGNLTDGGLSRNCEYGVSSRVPRLVKEARHDFEGYAKLGAPLSIQEIEDFASEFGDLRTTYQTQNRRLVKEFGVKFKSRLKNAEDRVLEFRAQSNTNQGIYRKTILYLLAKSALKTSELHPLIQQIHPDLCDDTIDRVIDGVNFGKKWKHHVRSAQQALKREGLVRFDGEKWYLANA